MIEPLNKVSNAIDDLVAVVSSFIEGGIAYLLMHRSACLFLLSANALHPLRREVHNNISAAMEVHCELGAGSLEYLFEFSNFKKKCCSKKKNLVVK